MSSEDPTGIDQSEDERRTLVAKRLEVTLSASGVDMAELTTCRLDSLRPTDKPASQPAAEAVQRLPPLTRPTAPEQMAQIQLREVIGGGGIGYVRAATQLPLEREVAVKALHIVSGRPIDDPATLLREARVQGALEHPQVVPVHLVGIDEGGQPLIVMKRIYGTPWADLIRAPAAELPGAGDALERHLRILIQVCNAVDFAHTHHIVHRDIKPGNVIIGDHGEVYLIDWGLAVAYGQDRFDLPRAEHIEQVAGTPAFMAPEMADPGHGKIDPRTDVYLLGGCLHNVLTRGPRHLAPTTFNELVEAALSNPCPHPTDTPEELVRICHKATHRESGQRYATARELRADLDAFLIHRSSIRLTHDALERAIGLFAYLEAPDCEARQAFERFGEARFGLHQALREWPDNPRARAGLQTLLIRVIEYAIRLGDERTAASLLDDLPDPSDELAARLQSLRDELDAERQRVVQLEAIAFEVDPAVGRPRRARLAALMVVPGLALFAVIGVLEKLDVFAPSYGTGFALGVAFGSAILVVWLATRNSELGTRLNQQLLAGLFVAAAGPLVLIPGLWYADVPYPQVAALVQLLWAVMAATLAAIGHRGILLGATALAVGFLVTLALPDWHWFIISASTMLALFASALPWIYGSKTSG